MPDEDEISSSVQSVVRFVELIHKGRILGGDVGFELRALDVVVIEMSCLRFREHAKNALNGIFWAIKVTH